MGPYVGLATSSCRRADCSLASPQAEAKYYALAELADLLEEVIREEEREQAAAQVGAGTEAFVLCR